MREGKMAKVVIGMSGGVDSSVAAYLLKQQGYEVIGVFMRNWDSTLNNDIKGNDSYNDFICPQEKDWQDAQEVCKKLNIPIYRVDFIKEYWEEVFEDFIEKYKSGKTPNPDILCNKNIKFKHFLDYALKTFNADFIAMGHYAKTENGKLFKAKDLTKDQSYFLAQLNNYQLSKTIFPLANITKTEVRKIATELDLITQNKKDSTGICFIGERKFTDFLQNYIPAQPGDIVDISKNKKIGKHIGIMYFTLGQRKGLGLNGMDQPYFVVGHNLEQKILYVAPQNQEQWLISDKADGINLNLIETNFDPNKLSVKFRYRQEDIPAKIQILGNAKIVVEYPQGFKAVTPGQEVVIYQEDKCIGAATIDKIYFKNKVLNYV
ncbi:tRNA 2-thiouridine(34) synthase MnmA [Mesomycoplasma hyorhinis]|uniref:tRNA 2-thiouridine(34) synthase MnmA n=1 Tax=Mesomycoplasma hyorhinis TaxID=2100 RepID=UPI00280A9BE5|nr:tRNA 2-thiouridine(34) synthase MnmA [Mesomycoplasma hyorhinis]